MTVSMRQSLVSVIIPVYKVESLLHRCVDSVLHQTHQHLEVILVDDGSPDRCGVICDDYAAQDARVRVVHQESGGVSAARNAGVRLATGDFITFVDSDDWLHPAMVAVLVEMAHRNAADIAMCGYVETDTEPEVRYVPTPDVARVLTNVEALSELLGARYVNMVVAWGKLYRRHLLTCTGLGDFGGSVRYRG